MKIVKHIFALLAILAVTMIGTGSARAAVTRNEIKDITGFSFFNPCANNRAGEVVVFQGNLHAMASFTINNNHISGSVHFNPAGLTGIGTVTGTMYHASGITQLPFSESSVNGRFEVTFIDYFRIIGPGPGDNVLVHNHAHMVVNANGEVTVNFENFVTDCR
jgi:hypothetical protein